MQEKTVGERIRKTREHYKISTQKEFGEILNIPFRTIQSYEQNKVSIPHTFLAKLIEKFEISIEWLLTGDGAMERSTSDCLKLNPILTLKAQEKANEFGMDIKQYIEHLVVQDIKQNVDGKQ